MRAVVQRVECAHVEVVEPDQPAAAGRSAEGTTSRTTAGRLDGPGLLVLVGVGHDDGPAQVAWLADKLAGLRLLRGDRSVVDEAPAGAGILLVSQFTLLGDVRRGRRPTWSAAAPGDVAEPLLLALAEALRARGATVSTGRFGADMRVHLVNDGPVTLVVDTP